MGSAAAATALVQSFRTRNTATVVWSNCQRTQVASDLDDRIKDPNKIDQNNTQWCGYASILNRAATLEQENYVSYVIGLFENGHATLSLTNSGSGVPIDVDDSILRGAPPTNVDASGALVDRMPQADYIALAGLRNHFKTGAASAVDQIPLLNLIKDFKGSSGGELCNALLKLGCTAAYDQSSVFSSRDIGYLNAASGHFLAGRIVILFIDASLIAMGKGNQGRGNHWIVLTSEVKPAMTAGGQAGLTFDCFSWGAPQTVKETQDVILKRFFGYVVGYM